MTPRTILSMTAALTLALANVAGGQAKMSVRPESRVTLAGSSNVHDWSCTGSEFNATIELDSGYATASFTSATMPIEKVVVMIPVKSLKCGKAKMDENMYKALRAEEFTEIRYELGTYKVDLAHASADSFVAVTEGKLTVAGQSKQVEIPITAVRLSGGRMKGEGALRMLMTDFGIKPPTALLGTLRTRNEISISFEVLLDRATVVALLNQ